MTDASLPPTAEPFLVTARGAPGLTPDQIRSRRYVAPSRGVRFAAEADQRLAEPRAALLVSGPDAVLTDVSAAKTWELPLPPWVELRTDGVQVSVSVRSTEARPQRNGVRGRRIKMPDCHVVEHHGVALTTAARTWLDCAALMPIEYVVAMGDVVLRRQLASRAELAALIRWGVGRRGVKVARRALAILDPGAESPGESRTRSHLVLGGIRPPACNLNIRDHVGWIARVDMSWSPEKVIVEYDGIGHLDEAQRRRDAARLNALTRAGWLVIVVTAADLKRPAVLVAMVESALRSRQCLPTNREW